MTEMNWKQHLKDSFKDSLDLLKFMFFGIILFFILFSTQNKEMLNAVQGLIDTKNYPFLIVFGIGFGILTYTFEILIRFVWLVLILIFNLLKALLKKK